MNNNTKPDLPPLDYFTDLETQIWETLVTGDAQADGAMLDPNFLGVYPSGFTDRDGHTGQLGGGPTVQIYQLDQMQLVPAGGEHVLLCYRARYLRTGSKTEAIKYVSSLWQWAGDCWLNRFSQDTPAA